MSWLDSLPAGETAITAITAAELRYGVHRLPGNRRKNELSEAVQAIITTDFRGRVQPFGVLAADQYADVVTARERNGDPDPAQSRSGGDDIIEPAGTRRHLTTCLPGGAPPGRHHAATIAFHLAHLAGRYLGCRVRFAGGAPA